MSIRSDGTRQAFLSDLDMHSQAIEESGTELNNLILSGETKAEALTPSCEKCAKTIDAFMRASKHIKGFIVPQLKGTMHEMFALYLQEITLKPFRCAHAKAEKKSK